jgi:hypothetical protein
MWKKMCMFALVAVCCWTVVADGPDYGSAPTRALPVAKLQPILDTAGHWTLDYATGELVEGTFGRSELIYDNTVNDTGFALDPNAFPPVERLGDGLWMPGDGLLESVSFSIFNGTISGGPLTRADLQIDFSDVYYAVIGSVFVDDLTFDPPIDPGSVGYVTVENLGSLNITLPYTCLYTLAYSDLQGGATALAQAVYDPPVIGESVDAYYGQYPGFDDWFWFDGNPVANFYFGLGVERSPTVTLYDMGVPRTCLVTGVEYWLGWISGYYDATLPQRWGAMPFYIDQSGTVITQIQANWWIISDPPAQADSVVAYIWHRSGLDRPTSFDDLFWQGIIGPYEQGGDDFRALPGIDFYPHHTYDVNIPIPAGDYYLTIFADGGDTPNALSWLTGGDGQDEALEQDFMWRSASFPAPGFEQYAPSDIAAGPDMTDGQDVWNATFMLRGTIAGCSADLDGDGDTDLADLAQLLGNYGMTSGGTFEDGDLDGDGDVDLADLAALLGDYGCS